MESVSHAHSSRIEIVISVLPFMFRGDVIVRYLGLLREHIAMERGTVYLCDDGLANSADASDCTHVPVFNIMTIVPPVTEQNKDSCCRYVVPRTVGRKVGCVQ